MFDPHILFAQIQRVDLVVHSEIACIANHVLTKGLETIIRSVNEALGIEQVRFGKHIWMARL